MTPEPESVLPVVKYNVTDAAIAELAEKCRDLTADTPAGYKEVTKAIAEVRTTRTSVEAYLKADALAWGKKVDAEAKRITAKLLEIEEPLKEKKQIIDDAKAAEARKLEETRKAIATLRAEPTRLAATNANSRELMHTIEQLEMIEADGYEPFTDDAQAAMTETLTILRDMLAAAHQREQEAADLEAKRQELARIEAEEKAKRDAAEAEARAKAEAEAKAKAEEEARIKREKAAPDIAKLAGYIIEIRKVADAAPEMADADNRRSVEDAVEKLGAAVELLEHARKALS